MLARPKNTSQLQEDWQAIAECFYEMKQAQGVAPRTLSEYRYHINRFFEHTGASMDDSQQLRRAVTRYFAESAKLTPTTYNIHRKQLKAFFTWAVSEKLIPESPMAHIRRRKENAAVRGVDIDVIRRLLALPNRRTFAGLRDFALLVFTMDTGARPSEAFSLGIQSFDFRSIEVTIDASSAKTRTSRTLPLSPVTVEVVKNLVAKRHPS